MELSVPGWGSHTIEHVVLDMNGTITLDGELLDGVTQRLADLAARIHVAVITADTHGGAAKLEESLGLETVVLRTGGEAEQKAEFVRRLGADRCVAIGNGANDVLMLSESALGICVIGREGASIAAVAAADLAVADIRDALDMLLRPRRLVATLRS